MAKWYYDYDIQCHWCGRYYKAKKGRLQARFCSSRCKQAHYRAYKKYVTAKRPAGPGAATLKVTPKRKKKRKK